jgi:hypothetical protein
MTGTNVLKRANCTDVAQKKAKATFSGKELFFSDMSKFEGVLSIINLSLAQFGWVSKKVK